jgi:hypothetical protein
MPPAGSGRQGCQIVLSEKAEIFSTCRIESIFH